MLGANVPSIIFYQQQEILFRHFTYTDQSLKMILAALDGETFQDQYFSDFIYDFLPLIDKHNKQRKNILNLKKSWTKTSSFFGPG